MRKFMYLNGFDFVKTHLQGPKILDIGNIGKSGFLHRKIREVFKNCEITGLDIDRKKAKEFNFPNQVIADAKKIPFPNNYFDGVLMCEILEHTFEPQKMIKEAHRVLKPRGVLLVTTPNPYALPRILRFFLKRMDTIGNPDHKIFYTPAIFKNILEKNNFEIKIISTDAIRIKSITIYLPRFKIFKMLGGNICIKAIKK
ncbi:MAG: class I SAM-dependent methyltransferase [Candidatus Nealsonbacteria bacterium]